MIVLYGNYLNTENTHSEDYDNTTIIVATPS